MIGNGQDRAERDAAIRQERERGMTLEQIGERHGLTAATIHHILYGRHIPGRRRRSLVRERNALDAEMGAIEAVVLALEPLDASARVRVLAYARGRLAEGEK